MEIKYTLLDESHINGIYELSKISFHTPWSIDSINAELSNNLAKYIVCEELSTGRVLGFVGVWIIAGEGNITNIAVDPDYRRLGIGSTLLTELFKLCSENQCNEITLEVRVSNTSAQNLYLNHGFVNEGIRKKYYEDTGEDAIIMWRR